MRSRPLQGGSGVLMTHANPSSTVHHASSTAVGHVAATRVTAAGDATLPTPDLAQWCPGDPLPAGAASIELPYDPSAASHARAFITEHMPPGDPRLTLLHLIVTELATNAYLYTPEAPWLVVQHHPDRSVTVVVHDHSSHLPHYDGIHGAGNTTFHGRGLNMIARASRRMGWQRAGSCGKNVWVELDPA